MPPGDDLVVLAEERDGNGRVPALDLRRNRQTKRRGPHVSKALDKCLSRGPKATVCLQDKRSKVLWQPTAASCVTHGVPRLLPDLSTLRGVPGTHRTLVDRRDGDHHIDVQRPLAPQTLREQVGFTYSLRPRPRPQRLQRFPS